MRIAVPKEIKNHEYRIGLTPAGARELTHHGHQVIVQRDGGKAMLGKCEGDDVTIRMAANRQRFEMLRVD